MVQPFVVVMNSDGQHALGLFLPDDIIIQHITDFARGRHAIRGPQSAGLGLLADDLHAQFDTFIANEHGRAGNQLADLVLAFATEGAVERILAVGFG